MTQTMDCIDAPDIASPCVNVCKMNAVTGLCEGCQRTIDEIASWSVYGAAEKRTVLAQLPARRRSV
jgi:predicted Fe-S protein YdhL (DUF1289 family)